MRKIMINPCPKCGSKNLLPPNSGSFQSWIKCLECGYVRGGFSTSECLIEVWNKESLESLNMELKWIDINKSKPKDGEVVVFLSADTYYPPTIGNWTCGNGYKTISGDPRTIWEVTHWIPLPPKP
jgi:hypothetical protein